MEQRTIGERGQIVVPDEFRQRLGFAKGAVILFRMRGEELIMQKAEDAWKKLERVPRGKPLIGKILKEKSDRSRKEKEKWN